LLQTGTITFKKNFEWHNKSYRDEFQFFLVKTFGAARVDYSTAKDNFETSPFKPGRKVQRWEKWCIEWLRLARTTPTAATGCISHSM
jgi:hypothetical protein